jgi:hypothetical protein
VIKGTHHVARDAGHVVPGSWHILLKQSRNVTELQRYMTRLIVPLQCIRRQKCHHYRLRVGTTYSIHRNEVFEMKLDPRAIIDRVFSNEDVVLTGTNVPFSRDPGVKDDFSHLLPANEP